MEVVLLSSRVYRVEMEQEIAEGVWIPREARKVSR